MRQRNNRRRYDTVKRGMDIAASAVGLVVTAPLQLAVGVMVLVKHGRPVLFRQERPGLNGQVFELVKFRSMRHPDIDRVSDDERLTPFGRAIRATSLDELPTLWNVLKGDMSLVGPRPLRTHYLPLYSPMQARRHEVRPGITGLAQVRGRNLLTWEKRFELDVHYVDTRSAWLDLRILVETLTTVLHRTGISAEGEATMTPFRGTKWGGDER
ncbi:sugar transferase [Tessaracoccus lubricantis]|uniref:Sugar transferase n=1 Tax=Tessaracoccus lubricantis TaxID=545543 RepID=A0ABP9FMX0_9ACTN